MNRSRVWLLIAWPLLAAIIGCSPEAPHAFGHLTEIRTQEGSSEVAGLTIYGLRNPRDWNFAVDFDADARRTLEELDQYRNAQTLVVVHFRGTLGEDDATAYRIDPSVTGLVVDITETDQRVEMTVQDETGQSWKLLVEQEPRYEFPLEHLKEHKEQKVPVLAFYRERGDERVAYILMDAP
jgi:hypothetical protein